MRPKNLTALGNSGQVPWPIQFYAGASRALLLSSLRRLSASTGGLFMLECSKARGEEAHARRLRLRASDSTTFFLVRGELLLGEGDDIGGTFLRLLGPCNGTFLRGVVAGGAFLVSRGQPSASGSESGLALRSTRPFPPCCRGIRDLCGVVFIALAAVEHKGGG